MLVTQTLTSSDYCINKDVLIFEESNAGTYTAHESCRLYFPKPVSAKESG